MKSVIRLLLALLAASVAAPLSANQDVEGCKPNPLFNRMPKYFVSMCEAREFDAAEIPIDVDAERNPVRETVEGPVSYVVYQIQEGVTPASPLQILRNHLNAAKAAGATVVKEFGAEPGMLTDNWTDIQQHVATVKLVKDGREFWLHIGSVNGGEFYAIGMAERQAMKQEVAVNELLDKLNRDGFLALYVNFDTGKATIKPDSKETLDQAAEMLKLAPQIKVEVGGHTDNVGTPESNQTLSQTRAQSVATALAERGIAADRLTAKGYGQSAPVADNRTEEGRAKNRRVELVKK